MEIAAAQLLNPEQLIVESQRSSLPALQNM